MRKIAALALLLFAAPAAAATLSFSNMASIGGPTYFFIYVDSQSLVQDVVFPAPPSFALDVDVVGNVVSVPALDVEFGPYSKDLSIDLGLSGLLNYTISFTSYRVRTGAFSATADSSGRFTGSLTPGDPNSVLIEVAGAIATDAGSFPFANSFLCAPQGLPCAVVGDFTSLGGPMQLDLRFAIDNLIQSGITINDLAGRSATLRFEAEATEQFRGTTIIAPEPSVSALFAAGVGLALAWRRAPIRDRHRPC